MQLERNRTAGDGGFMDVPFGHPVCNFLPAAPGPGLDLVLVPSIWRCCDLITMKIHFRTLTWERKMASKETMTIIISNSLQPEFVAEGKGDVGSNAWPRVTNRFQNRNKTISRCFKREEGARNFLQCTLSDLVLFSQCNEFQDLRKYHNHLLNIGSLQLNLMTLEIIKTMPGELEIFKSKPNELQILIKSLRKL